MAAGSYIISNSEYDLFNRYDNRGIIMYNSLFMDMISELHSTDYISANNRFKIFYKVFIFENTDYIHDNRKDLISTLFDKFLLFLKSNSEGLDENIKNSLWNIFADTIINDDNITVLNKMCESGFKNIVSNTSTNTENINKICKIIHQIYIEPSMTREKGRNTISSLLLKGTSIPQNTMPYVSSFLSGRTGNIKTQMKTLKNADALHKITTKKNIIDAYFPIVHTSGGRRRRTRRTKQAKRAATRRRR